MLGSYSVRTLSHYFVARYLRLFAGILLAATLAVSVIELLLNYEELAGDATGAAGVLSNLFLRVPSYYLGDLIPIAAFAAAFFSLGLAARWLELLAARAAGIPPHRIALPLIATSVVLAVGTLAFNETVLALEARGWIGDRDDGEKRPEFKQGAFWYHIAGSIYNVQGVDPATDSLRGLEIFERDDRGRLIAQIRADHAQLKPNGLWQLSGALVRRLDPALPEKPIEIQRGELEIHIEQGRSTILERTDAATLSLPQLAEYIALREADPPVGGRMIEQRANIERLKTLFHRRISSPLLVVLFTLLAIPIALRIAPGGDLGMAAVWSVATIGGFFTARNLAATVASEGVLSGAIATWAVFVVFAAGALAFLLRPAR
jgi:lipopolysaccharide export LptBFGC system permease protein LptF